MTDAAFEHALATAREAWPAVQVDAAAWRAALAALDADDALLAADHYLAFACAQGDPAALAACDALLVREAGFAADGARIAPALRDEAIQILREQLLARRADRPPAIGGYTGRGALRAWLRVSVSRELVRLAKAQQRVVALEDHLLADPGIAEDPVLERLKHEYRTELANAFRAALGELTPRDRTLLRYQLIDGLTIDELGTLYKVHRATAARWLQKIREDLVEGTRSRMAAALGVDTEEAASIVRLVQSQLDVSVIRHLGGPHDPGA
ncbi:MAG TPA: sigma-70 family RNA polymerase sigma factor [Kofleriaceae bacterium]|nr:sigma-70 family RNA polymerase sigma factor [Kofleriaceae bacterium]